MDRETYQLDPLLGSEDSDDGSDASATNAITTNTTNTNTANSIKTVYFRTSDSENCPPSIQEALDFEGFDGYIMLDPDSGDLLGAPVLQKDSRLAPVHLLAPSPDSDHYSLLCDFLNELLKENDRHVNSYMQKFLIMAAVGYYWYIIDQGVLCLQNDAESAYCQIVVSGMFGPFLWLFEGALYFAVKATKKDPRLQERLKHFLEIQERTFGDSIVRDDGISSHHHHHICDFYRLEYRPSPTGAHRPDVVFFVRKQENLSMKNTQQAQQAASSLPSSAVVANISNIKTNTNTNTHLSNQQDATGVGNEDRAEGNSDCASQNSTSHLLLPLGQVQICTDFVHILQCMPMNQGPWKEFCAEYQDLVRLKAQADRVIVGIAVACVVFAFVCSAMWGWYQTMIVSFSSIAGIPIYLSFRARGEMIFAAWVMMQLKLVVRKHWDDPTHICGLMDVAVLFDVRGATYFGGSVGGNMQNLLSFRHTQEGRKSLVNDMVPLPPSIAARLERLSLWDLLVPCRCFWEVLAAELKKQEAAENSN